MVSLASHLHQLKLSQQTEETQHATSPPPQPPPFPAGSELLSLGHYLVNLSAEEADQYPALDLRSRQLLNCRSYSLQNYQSLAPLVNSGLEGVHRVMDVTYFQDEVYVFSPTPAGDLYNFLKQRKKLKEGLAASIFRQIVVIVRDAHSKNVVLRDLKLKKFVFEDQEKTRLKLHTLDDAHLHEGSDVLADCHGCPVYTCPEMLKPGSYSGQAADLWSLGITLYTLLVGHYPFFGTNPQTLFNKIRSGHYTVPEHVSHLGRLVIRSLLADNPADRLPAEVILDHPWFERASDEPSSPPLPDQVVPEFVK